VACTAQLQFRVFNKAFRELDARIKIFTSLRLEMLDRMSLQKQLDAIGHVRADPADFELFQGSRQ
jgi:hypothetical protein